MAQSDPQLLKVEYNLALPFHYREQLRRIAKERDVSMRALILDAVERRFPPEYTQ